MAKKTQEQIVREIKERNKGDEALCGMADCVLDLIKLDKKATINGNRLTKKTQAKRRKKKKLKLALAEPLKGRK